MISGYRLRERLQETMGGLQKELRFAVRRRYLRQGIKHYGNYHDAITNEQRKAAKRFWSRYTKHFSPLWHEFYAAKTGSFDVRYVPEDIMFTEIEGCFNDWQAAYGIDNKCNYAMYFPEVKQAETYFRKMRGLWRDGDGNIISRQQAIDICSDKDGLIFKHAVEAGRGGGISFWNRDEGLEALCKKIDQLPQEAVCQALIVQHPALAALHAESVNCIRVMTLAEKDGIHLLRAYLRMGQKGHRVDYTDGCCCSIHTDGSLYTTGYDNMSCNPLLKHDCGMVFGEFKVPHFDRIVETALKLHRKIGDFRLISWDFSVNPEGEPVFIEMNLKYGGTKYHQLGSGPLFGDRTEEILNEVYGVKS